MTTSIIPPDTVRLRNPGELIAALPGLLGFPPTRSVVLLCFSAPDRLDLVARVDLPAAGDPQADAATAEHLASICGRRGVAGAVLVVVDEQPGRSGRRSTDRAAPRRSFVRHLRIALEDVGTEVFAVHHVARIEPGQPWGSYRSGAHGRVPDPSASPVAVAQVLAGRVIHGSRDEVARLLERDHTHSQGDVAAAVATVRALGPGGSVAARFATVTELVHRAEGRFSLEELARAAVTVGTREVRDACFAFPASSRAAHAVALWTTLVRTMPPPEQLEPAVLLAHGAYCRGEGPLAGLALDIALRIDPAHRMAGLISTALNAGLDPMAMQEIAVSALLTAEELGVPLEQE